MIIRRQSSGLLLPLLPPEALVQTEQKMVGGGQETFQGNKMVGGGQETFQGNTMVRGG